jgi:hypothetical protein
VKKGKATPLQTDLSRDFEKALLSTTKEQMRYEAPPVLTALARLHIKPKRIAQILHVSPDLVRKMTVGVQACPAKYLPALYDLLRNAVTIAKETCNQAERKEIMWGKLEYPRSSIAFMRTRIAEAEHVLEAESTQ